MAFCARLLGYVGVGSVALAALQAQAATADFLYADTAQLVPTNFASGSY